MSLRAISMEYRGVTFRSVLEANWAYTFDILDWSGQWSYEPEPVVVDHTPYLCDFYFYKQRLWGEVKGPHDERIDKPQALQRYFDREYEFALAGEPSDEWWMDGATAPLVVILRPPVAGRACWEAATPEHDITLAWCRVCCKKYFMDLNSDWSCRYGCSRPTRGHPYFTYWRSGERPFYRAPRDDHRVAA